MLMDFFSPPNNQCMTTTCSHRTCPVGWEGVLSLPTAWEERLHPNVVTYNSASWCSNFHQISGQKRQWSPGYKLVYKPNE